MWMFQVPRYLNWWVKKKEATTIPWTKAQFDGHKWACRISVSSSQRYIFLISLVMESAPLFLVGFPKQLYRYRLSLTSVLCAEAHNHFAAGGSLWPGAFCLRNSMLDLGIHKHRYITEIIVTPGRGWDFSSNQKGQHHVCQDWGLYFRVFFNIGYCMYGPKVAET